MPPHWKQNCCSTWYNHSHSEHIYLYCNIIAHSETFTCIDRKGINATQMHSLKCLLLSTVTVNVHYGTPPLWCVSVANVWRVSFFLTQGQINHHIYVITVGTLQMPEVKLQCQFQNEMVKLPASQPANQHLTWYLRKLKHLPTFLMPLATLSSFSGPLSIKQFTVQASRSTPIRSISTPLQY